MEKILFEVFVSSRKGMSAAFAEQVFVRDAEAVLETAGLESWSTSVESNIFYDRRCRIFKL